MSDEWDAAIEEIARTGGVSLLVGATDTGKTTFGARLASAAVGAGRSAAYLDADIGQSEIGPPGCVGLAWVPRPIRSPGELEPASLGFVGSTAPRGCLLEHAVAVRRLADYAMEAATIPHLLIVDTTGFVKGAGARRLKQAKADLLRPRHVVAIQRGRECEPILAGLAPASECTVHRLPVPDGVARKPPSYRAQRRAANFARYFHQAAMHDVPLEGLAVTGGWLNSAAPVPPHLRKFMANSLNARVYHAEQGDGFLGIITNTERVADTGLATLQEQFRPETIVITPASRLRHLYCGLMDEGGRVLACGLVESIDFVRMRVGILSPLRAPGAVRRIHFGLIRVRPDGAELGFIRPGDV